MQKKSLETLLYSAVGVVAMALIVIAVNVIVGAARQRADLTEEKAYTLSDGTRAILGKLDTTIKVRFYCSQSSSASPETVFLKSYAGKVEDLLAEYKQAAKGRIVIEKYDPQPDTDAEDSARLDGLEGQLLANGERFYLGLAVSLLDAKETIPFLAPNRERQLEYDLSRAISRVISPTKPVVGIMSPLPIFGMPMNPMMMQMGQRGQEPWALVNELKRDFQVKRVEMTAEKIDDEIKVLMVIHPKDITDAAQFAIDQFILRGGKLIAFLDAQSLVDSRGQNPMMGQMGGGGSSLPRLLKAWGLEFDTGKVVADLNLKMQAGGRGGAPADQPAWLSLTPDDIDTDDIITSEIDNLWYFCGGAFTGKPVEGLKQAVLFKSTKNSQLVDGFLASLSGEGILRDFKSSGVEYTLATRLTGKFKTAFPEGAPGVEKPANDSTNAPAIPASLKESKEETSVILVGDADMFHDNFSLRTMQSPFGTLAMAMNGNLNFAQNAVEQMSGDNNLISVRSRAIKNRPFAVVKRKEAEASALYMAKIQQLQQGRDEAMRRLNELQQQKSGNQQFILSPEQQSEIETLRKKEAEIGRQLRQVEKDLRRDVVALQNKVKWWNIAAVPLAVTFCGLVLAIYKRKLTAAK